MAARIVRRQALLVKVEAIEGTDASPSASTDAVRMSGDGTLELGAEVSNARPNAVSGLFDDLAPLPPAAKWFKMTFPVHLRGAGVTYDSTHLPEIDPILQAAGMSSTLSASTYIYDTVSTGLKSATVYFYMDGKLWKGLGCHADVNFTLPVGGPGVANCTLQGVLVQDTDTGFVAATYQSGAVPPIGKSLALTYNSVATLIAREFTCGLGNKIVARTNANAADSLAGFAITDRSSVFSIKAEDPTVAVMDFTTEWANANTRAFSALLGSATNNKVTFTFDKVTIDKAPKYSNDNGIWLVDVSGIVSMEGTNRFNILFS